MHLEGTPGPFGARGGGAEAAGGGHTPPLWAVTPVVGATAVTPVGRWTVTPVEGGAAAGAAMGAYQCAVCFSPIVKRRRLVLEDDDPCAARESAPEDGDERDFVSLSCGHIFHRECLAGCREHGMATCPICRADLPRGLTPAGARERFELRRQEEARENERLAAGLAGGWAAGDIAARAATARGAVATAFLARQAAAARSHRVF